MILMQVVPVETQVNLEAISTHMGWFDIVALLIMLIGVVFGLSKGLGPVLKWIIAVIVAQIASSSYSEFAANSIHAAVPIPITALNILSYLFIALGCIVIVHFVFVVLSLLAVIQFKSTMSRVGGFVFGAILSVLVLSLISTFLMLFPSPVIQEAFKDGSVSGPRLIEFNTKAHDFLFQWVPENSPKKPAPAANQNP